jgi:hypothetical protein
MLTRAPYPETQTLVQEARHVAVTRVSCEDVGGHRVVVACMLLHVAMSVSYKYRDVSAIPPESLLLFILSFFKF